LGSGTMAGILLVMLVAGQFSSRRQTAESAAQQMSVQSGYPETGDGLKSLLQDLLLAVVKGDEARSSAIEAGFAIPNHEAWFPKMFGPAEGARLEARYTGLHAQSMEWLKRHIEQDVKEGRTQAAIRVTERANETDMGLLRAVIAAEALPAPIYMVSLQKASDSKNPYYLGEFVYVEGGFRYLDRQVMHALSTAPPMRIVVSGAIQKQQLIERVQPDYPALARQSKLEGTVNMHVVIGIDGTVQRTQLVSGHPVLAEAAMNAVKRWRYKPTMLNGQPVEVDTAVEVIFSLRQ
jgi:TonB family protein